jgi:hypothetical protein
MAKTYTTYLGNDYALDLAYARRESEIISFVLYTNSSKTTVYDLTGAEVRAEVRVEDGSDILLDLSPAISSPETNGIITISPYISSDIEAQTAKYDILLTLPSGEQIYIVRGNFRIDPSITDDSGVDPTPVPTGANLQDLITSAYTRGIAKLPFGQTNITDTVVTLNEAGLVIEGHGSLWDFNPNLNGSHSKIMWATNNTTKPMIDCRGIHQYWRNFSLCGDNRNLQYGGKPTAGILVSDDAGLGPGKHTFDKFTIERCVAGIQAAELTTDSNCDVSSVLNGNWRHCQKAFYSKGTQVLDWSFYKGQFSNPDESAGKAAVFHYEGGGSLTSTAFAVVSTTPVDVLRLSQIHTGGKIGHNASSFLISSLKVDTLSAGTTLINVDQTSAECNFMPATVAFNDCKISGVSDSYAAESESMAILGGGIRVHFYRTRFAIDITESVIWHTSNSDIDGTEIWFVNCKLYGVENPLDILNITNSDGPIFLHVVGCTNSSSYIPDYHGVIEGAI